MVMENKMYDSATSWQAGVAAADDPEIYRVYKDGHQTVTVHPGTKLTHGAITGVGFAVGEIVSGGTSGRTGVVCHVDSGYVYVAGEIGASAWDTATPDTITGARTGSTADISSTAVSTVKVEESHSPHGSDVVLYKDWDDGDQTTALSRTLYGGARRFRFSVSAGFAMVEVTS